MPQKKVSIPFTEILLDRFLVLLVSILLFFILRPFAEGHPGLRVLMDLSLSFILLAGAYAVSQKKGPFVIASLIALTSLLCNWSRYALEIPYAGLAGKIAGLLFCIYITIVILTYLFREKEVTRDVIMAAICTYFLIGFMWAFAFSALEIIQPGSFNMSQDMSAEVHNFAYYSFVTLTTLGYGDITPLTSPARSMSLLEAVTGQLFIAILIAGLVGIYVSQSRR